MALKKGPRPRSNDPISITIALVNTGIAVATGTVAATLAAAFKFFAVQIGLSLLVKALAPKQRPPVDGGYKVNAFTTVGDHAIIYGETKVGGVIFYDEVTNNKKYLHRLIALAGHECESIGDVYFGPDKLTLDGDGNVTAPSKYAGKARIRKYLGGSDQNADSFLVNDSNGLWGSEHRAQGVCYLYARLEYDRKAFPQGVPEITTVVRGRKIYNPITDIREWTDNAALCALDFLTSDFGLGVNLSRINSAGVSDAVNICDEIVTTAAGKQVKRYTTNGSFTTQTDIQQILEALTGAMAGFPVYGPTEWNLKAGSYRIPQKQLGEAELRSSINLQTRHGKAENFNAVSGVFIGAETEYKESDYPEYRSPIFEEEDGEHIPNDNFNLPFTNTSEACQRISKIGLYNHREQINFTASFSIAAIVLNVGDTFKFTYERFGWFDKTFEVTGWKFRISDDLAIVIDINAKETSADIYDFNAEERDFQLNNTSLPDPSLTEIPGISYETELQLINEKATPILRIILNSDALYTDRFEVEYKLSSSDNWISLGTASGSTFSVFDVLDAEYDIRGRTITTLGIKGDWAELLNVPLSIRADPPDDVTGFSFTRSGTNLTFSWNPVASLDLSHYQLRRGNVNGSFTASDILVDRIARPATNVTVPAQAGTYYIKAIDKTGNQSINSASIQLSVLDFEDYKQILTIHEDPFFFGEKNGVIVRSNNLIRADYVSPNEIAFPHYTFDQEIDLGQTFNPIVEFHLESARISNSDDLVDSFGLIDDIQGLWDGQDFTDTNNSVQVSVDRGPYVKFQGGEIRGRRFRFRVFLETSTPEISTPGITDMEAIIHLKKRVETGVQIGLGNPSSDYSINFSSPFYEVENVVITTDIADVLHGISTTENGFNVSFMNSSGLSKSAVFSYIATGWGMGQ